MDLIKLVMAFVGHLGIWSVIFNQIHATTYPRYFRKRSEKAILLAVVIPLVWVLSLMVLKRTISADALDGHGLTIGYFYISMIVGLFFSGRLIWRKFSLRLPRAVKESRREWLNLKSEIPVPLAHGRTANLLSRLPFNQSFGLSRQRMTFELDVPQALDGLKICQLSDLHFTGFIGIEYFQRIVEEANGFDADLVFITGDIIDDVACLDWIGETLGRLKSRLGVFYVLGNHDLRIRDEPELRRRLQAAGLTQAAGAWLETPHQGATIQITGNALPWFRDADHLEAAAGPKPDLRILLSHSPDQLEWARQREFDLMFAGHTHGGQIALPFIGALVAPSKYGVLYAAGTFQIGNMIMHVSRGLSGDEAIRICSPPELGLFTIRSKNASLA